MATSDSLPRGKTLSSQAPTISRLNRVNYKNMKSISFNSHLCCQRVTWNQFKFLFSDQNSIDRSTIYNPRIVFEASVRRRARGLPILFWGANTDSSIDPPGRRSPSSRQPWNEKLQCIATRCHLINCLKAIFHKLSFTQGVVKEMCDHSLSSRKIIHFYFEWAFGEIKPTFVANSSS